MIEFFIGFLYLQHVFKHMYYMCDSIFKYMPIKEASMIFLGANSESPHVTLPFAAKCTKPTLFKTYSFRYMQCKCEDLCDKIHLQGTHRNYIDNN